MITTRSSAVKKVIARGVWIQKRKTRGPQPIPAFFQQKRPAVRTEDPKEKAKNDEILKNWEAIRNATAEARKNRDFPQQHYFTHFKLLEKYPNETWTGKRCFIIGGGPSLKNFDFSVLERENTIAINRAYEHMDPSIIFFTDNDTFYKKVLSNKFGVEARDKFINTRALKIALNIGNYNYDHGTYSVPLSKAPFLTTHLKDGLFDGGNSGFAALNLAICLEANPIYLLGFDMAGTGDGKQAWWHDGYEEVGSDKAYTAFIKYFEDAAKEIQRSGSQVINLNRKSHLKCFNFGDIKDIQDLKKYQDVPAFDTNKIIKYAHEDLYFDGAMGLGDNLFQRPVIKDLAGSYKTVYLTTALPEAYWDIPNVKFVRPGEKQLRLRTQEKLVSKTPKRTWSNPPKKTDTILWGHVGPSGFWDIKTKYTELENKEDFDFTFPLKREWVEAAHELLNGLHTEGKKVCIVRRPTIRKEWPCPARNPKPEYYQLLIDTYKNDYYFVGLADIEKGQEWFDGDITGIDKEFNKGEIPITTIFGLLKIADMTITYPSLFMISAIAVRGKCFTIFGGIAAPEQVLRKNLGYKNFGYVAPEPACACGDMQHDCKKDILHARILERFEELHKRPKYTKIVTVGTPPGIGDSYWVLTKLQSFVEKNAIDTLRVAVHRDPIHYYTAEFLKKVKFIDHVIETPDTFKIHQFYIDTKNPGVMARNTQNVDYLIDAGAKMWINGDHLEDILPEYETNYDIPIDIPQSALDFADGIKRKNGGKMILFYTSSLGNNGNWNPGDWTIKNWFDYLELLHKHTGARPIAIGAEWDQDYTAALKQLDKKNIIQDYTGSITILQTLALIKQARLVSGFASGIPIFAVYNKIPTVMFWAIRKISKNGHFDPAFQYTWTPKGTKESGLYFPVAYGAKDTTPKGIFERIKDLI